MSIASLAGKVVSLLRDRNQKLVLAESCTGGLVCGALTRVPGVSNYLCGGMVTYRNETKQEYLGISDRLLRNPGAVSEIVARQMADKVLERTPEASVAAAVTGYLGPQAPAELDGVVYLAAAQRQAGEKTRMLVRRHVCTNDKRLPRQREAIAATLSLILELMEK